MARQARRHQGLQQCGKCSHRSHEVEKVINPDIKKKFKKLCARCLHTEMLEVGRAQA